ncbi:17177_t:CDS:2, partial [Funneliformis geosporum]
IPFMTIENEGSTERINETHSVFFDILVSDGETPDKYEERVIILKKSHIYEFIRMVARENGIQLSGWSTINKYICKKEDFTTISDRFPISALLQDRTLILTWDIETYASQMGEFAEVLEQKNKVFMINPRWVIIICGNQVNLLKAFALCWRAFASDIQVGFNDSTMINKYCGKIGAKSENNFMMKGKKKDTDEKKTIWESGEKVEEKKDYMGAIKIKITGEEDFFSSFLKLPGCIPIDVRVCLKKRYSHSEVEKEGSLKFFLKKCSLDTKADMPYDEM